LSNQDWVVSVQSGAYREWVQTQYGGAQSNSAGASVAA
jgi:hypothetical protein